ncbi:hypothetical protein LTR35_018251 [Friedmanniomyces endolithicus]|nr:hypothetical protein LTR35_018251 [Friedmanniomyces endolithicus]
MVHGGMVLYIGSGTPQVRIYHLVCTRPDKISKSDHQFHEITKRPSSAPREDYLEAGLQYLPVHLEPRRIPLHEGHDSTSSDTEHPTLPDDDAGTTSSAHEHSLEAGLERLMDFFVNEMTGLQNLYLKFLMLYDTQEGIGKT